MNNNIKAEWNIDETKKKYWAKIRHPFNGGFELTQKCNFRCVHCYLQNGGYKDFLSTQDVKLILDKLAQKGILFLYFTGGEVFTRKDFEVIWRYAKKLGLNIWCYTGFTYEQLMKLRHVNPAIYQLLEQVDVLVDGRFELSQKSLNLKFKGSRNQRIIDVPKSLKENRVVTIEKYNEEKVWKQKYQKDDFLYI